MAFSKTYKMYLNAGKFFIFFVFLVFFVCGRVAEVHSQDMRGTIYFSYVRNTYDMVRKSYYRKVDDRTLIKGAFDRMKETYPSTPVPADYSWGTLEAFYMSAVGRDPDSAGKLAEACLDGIIDSLKDPYSVLLTPDKKKTLRGDGSGVGLELGAKNGKITVIAPVAGSPAEKAGFKSGDVLQAVNGVSVKGMSLYEGSILISGVRGESIAITVERGGKTITLKPLFEELRFQPIEYLLLSNNIGYIRISFFSGKIYDEFVYALNVMKQKNAKGLILDLRNNPGGDLMEALRIAARFVPNGTLVWVKKEGREPEPRNSGSGESFPVPVVILINEGSASASEVLAAAVSENKKAVLMGRRTFGKGVIQTVFKLSGDAQLNLTTEAYLTPDRHDINGVGIMPKYLITNENQDRDPTRDPYVIAAWKLINNQ